MFLQLLGQSWPSILAAEGRLDATLRRRLLVDALTAKWHDRAPAIRWWPPASPARIPSVARLLARIAQLPDGMVVLQALDRTIEDADWDAVGPTHPQYGLKQLLELMGVDRAAVGTWPASDAAAPAEPRVELWSQVLRPAATTEEWRRQAPATAAATAGLQVAIAPDIASEALEMALRLRQALETPGKQAVLITPSRALGRRVAAELLRWGIRVDDSAGVPLDQSPPGTFLLLTAHLVAGGAAPVTLLSALKHPLARGGIDQGEFRRLVRALERGMLRGPRLAGGLEGLAAGRARAGPGRTVGGAGATPQDARSLAGGAGWRRHGRSRELLAAGANPLPDLLAAHLAFRRVAGGRRTGR